MNYVNNNSTYYWKEKLYLLLTLDINHITTNLVGQPTKTHNKKIRGGVCCSMLSWSDPNHCAAFLLQNRQYNSNHRVWMEKTTVFPSGAIFWNHSLAAHEIIVSQFWTYIGDCSYKFPANHHRLSINHNHRVCGPALMITCLRAFLALIMEIDDTPIALFKRTYELYPTLRARYELYYTTLHID